MVGASTIVERTHKTSNLKWRQGSLISQNPLNLWGVCQYNETKSDNGNEVNPKFSTFIKLLIEHNSVFYRTLSI